MIKLFFIALAACFSGISFPQQEQTNTMTAVELKSKLQNGSEIIVLDVRTPHELSGPLGQIKDVINIPIQELEDRINELEKYKSNEIAVICRTGVRSEKGTKILNSNGFSAKNVLGGMTEYRRIE
jgi:rhodanese-related sulfurtransferase